MFSRLRRKPILALVGAASISASAILAFFLYTRFRDPGRHAPLDAIPKDAFAVITVDMTQVRSSPVYSKLMAKDAAGKQSINVGSLTDACGFDPFTRIREIAFAVPEGGDSGEFGIAISGEATRDELLSCVRKSGLSASEASDALKEIKTHSEGTFTVIERATNSSPNDSAMRPKAAFRMGGPLVLGRGSWFAAMLESADGKRPSFSTNDEHTSLRKAVSDSNGTTSTPYVIATALLPKDLRERLKKQLATESSTSDGNAAMAGVLGVSSVGASLATSTDGATTMLTIEFRCETAPGCEAVQKLVEKKKLEWSKDLKLRLFGVGPLIDSLEVRTEGTRLHASTHVATNDLASGIERLARLTGGMK